MFALASPAHADSYPSRQITIMPLLAPGTGARRHRAAVRLNQMAQELRQAGGGREPCLAAAGLIGIAALKAAPADGYTLIVATSAVMAIRPALMKQVPYDAEKDFVPIELM